MSEPANPPRKEPEPASSRDRASGVEGSSRNRGRQPPAVEASLDGSLMGPLWASLDGPVEVAGADRAGPAEAAELVGVGIQPVPWSEKTGAPACVASGSPADRAGPAEAAEVVGVGIQPVPWSEK